MNEMIESAYGGEISDSVAGYLHEDYDSAKAREESKFSHFHFERESVCNS